ncbi:hypothetical protein F8388_014073 [Cannabis sativa]|uniref:Uncharacterized protein n=1 Tax=Cannabis sativa TaxID=3483 RepID=A0A7J6GL23_CANSA|nr:hypothetical protein G4B88_012152 [Cannabis sativa]KAF4383573.1 hypothetical protein F8388_014073 [Cannabis sativa]
MGNQYSLSSCVLVNPQLPTANLFDAKGNFLRPVKLPLKAAELMLEEEPGHVISPAEDLRRTGRYSAMRAEDDLVAKKVYFLVPMSRVNRKISDSDMEIVKSATLKKKKSKNSSRVSPAMVATAAAEEELEGSVVVSSVFEEIGNDIASEGFNLGRPIGNNRLWKPVLETISEC